MIFSIKINLWNCTHQKIFGNVKDNSHASNTDLSTLNSIAVDETINSCGNILDSLIAKTVNCISNLSTTEISEKYDQRKNVKKKLLADKRKHLHEYYNSIKSNNELFHYRYKTLLTTPNQGTKGTTLIACFTK